jgi:Cof subfamily protein (haloacid dehalogenase superfamily)
MDTKPDIKPYRDGEREITAVVIDLDGTLLNDEHQMGARSKAALQKAAEKDIKIILATGKTRDSAEALINELNLQTPGVFVQGLLIYDADGNIKQEQSLDAKTLRRAIQYAESAGFEIIAYSRNRLLVKSLSSTVDWISDFGEPAPQAVGSLLNKLYDTKINKIMIVGGNKKKLTALRWQLDQQIGTNASFTFISLVDALEVLPKGASKGNALRTLLREMNIDPLNVLAIGDGENDIEMLKIAGLGVAVENADDKLKDVAQDVVGSNNDDGVADALEKYVLDEPVTSDEPDTADTDEADTDDSPSTEPVSEAQSTAGDDASDSDAEDDDA